MLNLFNEYFLNTSIFFNEENNIFNKKIYDITKKTNMMGGGSGFDFDISDYICLLIGIIIIIIGIAWVCCKSDWIEYEANINSKELIDNNKYKINIKYIVNSTEYSKIITIEKNLLPNQSTQTIKIYYQESNPNIIQLLNPNYFAMGIGLIIFGSLVIILSLGSKCFHTSSPNTINKINKINKTNTNPLDNSNINLYSSSTDADGMKIVYSK